MGQQRRARGSGGLRFRDDGVWVFMVDLGKVDGRRKRRAFYGRSAEEAEAKGRVEFPDLPPADTPPTGNLRVERMRAARALGTHTRREWHKKLRDLDHRCHYCGADTRAPDVGLHKDHRIPVSRGGSDALENVVPACHRCNFEKHDMTDREFALLRQGARW